MEVAVLVEWSVVAAVSVSVADALAAACLVSLSFEVVAGVHTCALVAHLAAQHLLSSLRFHNEETHAGYVDRLVCVAFASVILSSTVV